MTAEGGELLAVFRSEMAKLMKVVIGIDERVRTIESMLRGEVTIVKNEEKLQERGCITPSLTQSSCPTTPVVVREKKGRANSKNLSSLPTVSPLSVERREEIRKLLSQENVTLHFMNNYKKIAILTFEKETKIATVKQSLQNELTNGSSVPSFHEVILSKERPLVNT